jgi:hypothetical protein
MRSDIFGGIGRLCRGKRRESKDGGLEHSFPRIVTEFVAPMA